jgi:hypothetical protein
MSKAPVKGNPPKNVGSGKIPKQSAKDKISLADLEGLK